MRQRVPRPVSTASLVLLISVAAVCMVPFVGSRLVAQERPTLEYRVLATSKTSTMEKELNEATESGFQFQAVRTGTLEKELREAAAAGFEMVGMTVSKTALGGSELVAITRRPRTQ